MCCDGVMHCSVAHVNENENASTSEIIATSTLGFGKHASETDTKMMPTIREHSGR